MRSADRVSLVELLAPGHVRPAALGVAEQPLGCQGAQHRVGVAQIVRERRAAHEPAAIGAHDQRVSLLQADAVVDEIAVQRLAAAGVEIFRHVALVDEDQIPIPRQQFRV